MAKASTFKVELKNMTDSSSEYKFTLENDFFDMIDAPEVRKGRLQVVLIVKKNVSYYSLKFHTVGAIYIPCNRCLDDMELPIDSKDELKVKLGTTFSEEGDIVIVPEEDGYINVAWFIYEFIALNIPIKHVHASGQCNKGMMKTLKKHLRTSSDDVEEDDDFIDFDLDDEDEDKDTDPRWDGLKQIKDNIE